MGVSCSCQQLTGLPGKGVPGLMSGSRGSPAHFRETSAGIGQVTSRTPTLGPFLTQASLMPLPELLIPFCQAVLITWASSQSQLCEPPKASAILPLEPG